MKWYHQLIPFNWMLSLLGLTGINEYATDWQILFLLGWFCASSLLLIYADNKGLIKYKDPD